MVAPGGGACMVAPGGMHGCSEGMRGCSGGGMHGYSRGACMVAPGGCVVAPGGMHGCSRGACMVAPGGHAWLLLGGMRGCSGGHALRYPGRTLPPPSILADPSNVRHVSLLLRGGMCGIR